eukprot:SAG22_NODE_1953_length_3264_cov_3.629068_3_plen_266_part_00
MNEKVIELRRVALESYLQELVADVNLRSDEALRVFLEEPDGAGPIQWASEEAQQFQSAGAILDSKLEACAAAIEQLATGLAGSASGGGGGGGEAVDAELARLREQQKALQEERASLFRIPKPRSTQSAEAEEAAMLAARPEVEDMAAGEKAQRVMIETADGSGWSLRFFSVKADGLLSIFVTPSAASPIAVIPTELCLTRAPKSKREDAPHAFRLEVETKGNMARITVGMGFQSKYIVDPGTKEDKAAWQQRLGPRKVGVLGRKK